ncbi:MAG: DMT family transporter [Betaproteobacteria bacterium]|jgi:drug/metabolite transporter (DMT)-like permease|nr:DMT family transporter [Polynucleobacter sp.]NBY65079.1 DMT family transporter [Betaproteobacteria bacterium]
MVKNNAIWMSPLFILIWSTGFIIARYGMPHAEPLTFLAIRFFGVILILLPCILWFKAPWPSKSQIVHLAIAGVLIQFGYLAGVWIAIRHGMPVGLTALIVGLQPILTAVFVSLLAEKITRSQWQGLFLGLFGVFLVLYAQINIAGVNAQTIFFNITGLLSITVGTIYQKKYCAQFDLRTGSLIQFITSLGLATIGAFLFETREVEWVLELIGALVWGIVGISIGAMSLLFILIRRGNATKVSSLMYLTPPTTAIMGWILFNEPLTILVGFGTLLTMLGVLIVNQTISFNFLRRFD